MIGRRWIFHQVVLEQSSPKKGVTAAILLHRLSMHHRRAFVAPNPLLTKSLSRLFVLSKQFSDVPVGSSTRNLLVSDPYDLSAIYCASAKSITPAELGDGEPP